MFLLIIFLIFTLFSYSPLYAQPSSYDWRDVGGVNYITSIKDQEVCGACVAYATTAALETWLVRNGILSRTLADLSEQTLISCCSNYTGDCGSCSGGTSTLKYSSYLYNYGIPSESCFVETHANTACGSACGTFQTQTYKIIDYINISPVTTANLKSAIYNYGPIICDMQEYLDFFNFTGSGVYHYDGVSALIGGHTLLVVGYNDAGSYFIVKNSWSTAWGDSGFGKIGYDQVGDGKVNFGTASFYYTGAYTHNLPITVNWPLKINTAGRYLEDQSSVPFFILGDASWELTTQITDADVITYLDNRQAKGFTGIEVRLIGRYFQDHAPNDYYNNAPFTNGVNDWSARNETYWARMDTIIAAAKARNMVVFLFPAYLGYNCGEQGWCANMANQSNDAMTSYGQWIGNRYKDYGNIIWMTAGDYCPTAQGEPWTTWYNRMVTIVSGIRSSDTDAMFSAEGCMDYVSGVEIYPTGLVDINGIYTKSYPQSEVQTAYNDSNSKPSLYQEGCYENSSICTNNTALGSVSQAMISYLGGALAGHIWGGAPLWGFHAAIADGWASSLSAPYFDTWQHHMESPASVGISNVGKLMKSRKWWTFVPDYSNTVVTSSKGTQYSYHATARETTGQTVMVWCPDTNVVTVDMTKISGTTAKAWWWNSSDNSSILIGTYATTGTQNFTPSSVSKVLVLDNMALNLPAPGTTLQNAGVYPSSVQGLTITGGTLK